MNRFVISLLVLWLCSVITDIVSAEEYRQELKIVPATLRFEVDKTLGKDAIEVRLSDIVPLTVTFEGPATLEVEKIDQVTKSEFWRVREFKEPEKIALPDGRIRWKQSFELEPMNKGDLTLQIAPLRYRLEKDKGDWQIASWEPIKAKVMTEVVSPDLSQMRPITDPEPLPEARPWWTGALRWGGLALVVLALLLGALELKRRFAPAKPELAPHEWAIRELARLDALGLPAHGQADRFHTLLSDTMRRYLELRFRMRAPRQTTAEFLEAMRQAPQLTSEQRLLLRDFLERCDLAKFARAEFSAEECQGTSKMARTFVDQTRPVVPEQPLAKPTPA
jgi:hypothetical protein